MAEDSIEVVAHCLLNPRTRVKGLGPLNFKPEGDLIQLPCPEAIYMGLDRWAVTRNQLDVPEFRRFCRSLLDNYADLIELLAKKGCRIKLVGVKGSPSCGIENTSSGYPGGRVRDFPHKSAPGPGVFMEELLKELNKREVQFEFSEADKADK
jgi:predicted secreted protein